MQVNASTLCKLMGEVIVVDFNQKITQEFPTKRLHPVAGKKILLFIMATVLSCFQQSDFTLSLGRSMQTIYRWGREIGFQQSDFTLSLGRLVFALRNRATFSFPTKRLHPVAGK